MRTVIVIPSRLGSTRLPRKALAPLKGVPLVVRVAQQALKCREVDAVVVATDAEEIAEVVRGYGISAVMTRDDHQSGSDRVAEAARIMDAEFIINVQGDEPFIDPDDVDVLAKALKSGTSDIVTLKVPCQTLDDLHDPNTVKVVCRDDDTALYFSRAPIPYDRSGVQGATSVFRHIGVYGFRRAALERLTGASPHALELRESLEQLRALAMGMTILVLPARTFHKGIDTEHDLLQAQAHIATLET